MPMESASNEREALMVKQDAPLYGRMTLLVPRRCRSSFVEVELASVTSPMFVAGLPGPGRFG